MPKYNFLLCSGRSRVKYPKSFHLMDIEAARQVGGRIAQLTREVVPQWNDLPSDQQKNFAVEVVDGAGQTVLTLPCKAAEELTAATTHLTIKKPHQDCSTDGANGEGSRGGDVLDLEHWTRRRVR
jgi:xanthine dehydrogenase molybdopterin-binding subunit B